MAKDLELSGETLNARLNRFASQIPPPPSEVESTSDSANSRFTHRGHKERGLPRTLFSETQTGPKNHQTNTLTGRDTPDSGHATPGIPNNPHDTNQANRHATAAWMLRPACRPWPSANCQRLAPPSPSSLRSRRHVGKRWQLHHAARRCLQFVNLN